MNEFTPEQAKDIHDIDSYKKVTGAKRFKRTKEELVMGLSPEHALQQRLMGGTRALRSGPLKMARRPSKLTSGNMTIRVRPESGVNPEYFAQLPKDAIELVLNEKFYSWFDTKLEIPYNGDATKLFQHIFNLGIGEVLSNIHSTEDIKDYDE